MGFRPLFGESKIDFNGLGSIHLYTDGSAIRNGCADSACGWAYICRIKDNNEYTFKNHGGCKGATNNQMEMTAVLEGLKVAETVGTDRPLTIYSDSKYVIETLKGNYKIGKNHQLWAELIKLVRKFDNVQFQWVKGHSTNTYNNEVDKMAVSESKKYDKLGC